MKSTETSVVVTSYSTPPPQCLPTDGTNWSKSAAVRTELDLCSTEPMDGFTRRHVDQWISLPTPKVFTDTIKQKEAHLSLSSASLQVASV